MMVVCHSRVVLCRAVAKGATAIEPEQNSIGKRVDTHAVVMKELAEIRCLDE